MDKATIQQLIDRLRRWIAAHPLVVGALGLGLLVVLGLGIYLALNPQAEYPLARIVRYRLEIRNETGRPLKNVAFWTLGPVARTAYQQSTHIEASHPFKIERDKLGNQVLHFKFAALAPYAARIVTITARLRLARTPQPLPGVTASDYAAPDQAMPTGNKQLIALAGKLKGKNPRETAKRTMAWVHHNVHYAGYTKDRRGALYAYQMRKGDCTEYTDLFGALTRIAHIPTRAMGGFISSENALLRVVNYHNWAEIYLDGRWRVVDPQNGVFLKKPSDYIALQILGNPKGAAGPVQLFGSETPGLRISMQ